MAGSVALWQACPLAGCIPAQRLGARPLCSAGHLCWDRPPHAQPTATLTTVAMRRDARLDVWRGLCLVDVVLVHLAYGGIEFPEPFDAIIKDYTRFAAGGFVFLAGLTVATVFSHRLARAGDERRAAHRWLWRRAAVLLLVDAAAAAAFCALDAIRQFPVHADATVLDVLRDVPLLRRPGLTGGIFVLYAVLLAGAPAMFVLWRRAGGWALAAASGLLYAAALWGAPWLDWPDNSFPIAYWQPIFVSGLLFPGLLAWLDAGPRGRRIGWALAVGSAFALVFLTAHGCRIGIPAAAHLLPLDFAKTPLQPGALLWYLAAVQFLVALTALAWSDRLASTRAARWLGLLGRHSLLVYTAHVFTEALVLEHVWGTWPPAGVRLLLVLADLAVLTALCQLVEQPVAQRCSAGTRLALAAVGRLVAARPAPAIAVMAVVTLFVAIAAISSPRTRALPALPVESGWVAPVGGTLPPSSVLDDALFEPAADPLPFLDANGERDPRCPLESPLLPDTCDAQAA